MTAAFPYTNNIDGWMFPEELAWLYETAHRMRSIVEIGCWKGRSTHALLSGCPGLVYAVDHFKGTEGEPAHAEALTGHVRQDFMVNVGGFANLRMIERDSIAAAGSFDHDELDMVFIDGAHDYESVMGDLKAWENKARVMIAGHDYSECWPDVVQAVNDFFAQLIPHFPVKRAAESIWYVEL